MNACLQRNDDTTRCKRTKKMEINWVGEGRTDSCIASLPDACHVEADDIARAASGVGPVVLASVFWSIRRGARTAANSRWVVCDVIGLHVTSIGQGAHAGVAAPSPFFI
jgi:hypothetical protein